MKYFDEHMKKAFVVFGILIFLLVPFVAAEETQKSFVGSIGNFIERALGPIFVDFAESVPGASLYMWIRIMLFFFLFALLFGSAGMIPWLKEAGMKRIRVVITLVIALIMSIMMSNVFVDAIAKTYSIVAIFVLMMLPVAGIIYLAYIVFPTGAGAVNLKGEALTDSQRRFNHVIKAVLFFLLMTIIHNYGTAIESYKLAEGVDWIEWTGIAEGIAGIMFLWHLIMAITMSIGTEEGREEFFEGIREKLGLAPKEATPATYPMHLRASIDQLNNVNSNISARIPGLLNACNIVLIQNQKGAVQPDARRAVKDAAAEIKMFLTEAEHLINTVQSDARFGELLKRDRNRFNKIVSVYVDLLERIRRIEVQYESNLRTKGGKIKI